MSQYIEDTGGLPLVKQSRKLMTGLAVDFSNAPSVTLPNTITATPTISGAITPTGGIGSAGGFGTITDFSTGQRGVTSTTGLNQKQIVTTESYYAEIFVEGNCTITGVSVLNGHTTNGGVNLNVGLANSAGTIVASSATTTAQGTADSYQQIPFSSTYAAKGPAKYYVVVQGSQTTGFLAMHAMGNFGASKVTSETYGTFTSGYTTTTFTANLGPVADTY